ncbi:MAG: isochorismatase family protein [Patescibacteria group bacterium]
MVKEVTTIVKPYNNGFELTKLEFVLNNLGVRRLVVTGINASFCVQSTVCSAIRRELDVFTSDGLLADCDCSDCRRRDKSRSWYERETTFFHQPTSLEDFLGATSRKRKT